MIMSLPVITPRANAQMPGDVSPLNASVNFAVNQTLTFSASYPIDNGNPASYPSEGSPELDVSIGNSGCVFALQWSSGVPTPSFSVSDGANCQASLAGSSYSQGSLSFNVTISFAATVVGQTFFYNEQALDNASGNSSGWWQDPGASITITTPSLGPPQIGMATPSHGSGPPNQQTNFSITASDPNGWGINSEVDIFFGPQPWGPQNGCLITLFPGDPFGPRLFSDDLTTWTGVGNGSDASNSQCTLLAAGSGYSFGGAGNSTLTLNYNIRFFPSYVGAEAIMEQASDQWATTGWGSLGSFTVVGQPIITTTCLDVAFGVVGYRYATQLDVQGSRAPYNWSWSGNTIPGVVLQSNGTFTGAPSQTGNFSISFNVYDTAGNWATPLNCNIPVILQSQMSTASGPISNTTMYLGKTDVGVFRNSKAFLEDSNEDGVYEAGIDRFISNFYAGGSQQLGDHADSSDIAVAGDWTGDGVSKVGIYRQRTGQWFLDFNNDGVYKDGEMNGGPPYGFGGCGPLNPSCPNTLADIPVVGNWSGGTPPKDCIGVFRNGYFWVLDSNCNGGFDATDPNFPFGGISGDVPVVGKWLPSSPQQPTRVGLVRKYAPGGTPQGNPFFWVTDAGAPNAGNAVAQHPVQYAFAFGGLQGDVFLTGDWLNNGMTQAAVYRPLDYGTNPPAAAGLWVTDAALPSDGVQSHHTPELTFPYGGALGDIPIVGTWAKPDYDVTPPSVQVNADIPVTGSAAYPLSSPGVKVTINDPTVNSVTISFSVPAGISMTTPICTTVGQCTVTGAGGASTVRCTSTCTFTASVQVFSNTAPSAVGSPASGTPYNIKLFATSSKGANLENAELPVYVKMVSSLGPLMIRPNLGPIDMGKYAGYADRSATTPSVKGTDMFNRCPLDSTKTPADCMRYQLNNYVQNQHVTGVVVSLGLCDSNFGRGFIKNCDSTPVIDDSQHNTPSGLNTLDFFNSFLQDITDSGIRNLTVRMGPSLPEATGRSMPGTGCMGEPLTLLYVPSMPFPFDASGDAAVFYDHTNEGYNCFPTNDKNFVGWDILLAAYDAVFNAMHLHQIQLDELSLLDEVALQNDQAIGGETIALRLFYDPFGKGFSTSYTSPVCTDPPRYSLENGTLVSHDILRALRCVAQKYSMDPGAITMSTGDARSDTPGYNCSTQYGNAVSSRVANAEQLISAIKGGPFGGFSNLNFVNSLLCRRTDLTDSNQQVTIGNPNPYTFLPTVIDMHSYPCLTGMGHTPCADAINVPPACTSHLNIAGESCSSTSSTSSPPTGDPNDLIAHGEAYLRTEARENYNQLQIMVGKYYTGTKPRIAIGEAYPPRQPSDTHCILLPDWSIGSPFDGREQFVGFRQSMNTYTGCNLLPNDTACATIRPFTAPASEPCDDFPLQLVNYGYDLRQR
jgi:hypothetical protein